MTDRPGRPPSEGLAIAEVLVRQLVRRDAVAYRALMIEGYDAEPGSFIATAAEREGVPLEHWITRIDSTSGLALGAFAGDALLGAVALAGQSRFKLRHAVRLVGLYVRASARGGGLGRRLVEAAITAAVARETWRVLQADVIATNTSAESLYRSCGFRAWGTEPAAVDLGDGLLVPVVHLWLDLRQSAASAR